MKFSATKGPRRIIKPAGNVRLQSSKTTQKKQKLQAKFKQSDVARQNAANNCSMETPLRTEEEERKLIRTSF